MSSSSVTFPTIGLVAVAIGFGGVGSLTMNIGWVLLAVGVVLFLINAITGKRAL